MVGTRVGDVLASKYRLEELLGSGGMGHVYRAVNEDIGRVVAIKVLRAEHATNGPIVERFLREARAANLVRHPNVVDVLDIGRDGDGSPFIVQEFLKGKDLANYVEKRGGKLTLAEIEEYLLPVIDAVAEAHARGVVHRDIKPENVFLAEEGKRRIPKLLDFGISKIRVANVRATEVGVMMGTPAYMAPEQIQGARDADPRSDVWALGIMLFELLSGRLPFDADDAPALFVAIATKDVPRLSDVCPEIPPNVSRVCDRCLRRKPDDRYPSALELARDLRHVYEGTEIESTKKISIPPPAAPIPQLAIPDLELPRPNAKTPQSPARSTAMQASPHSPIALNGTELSTANAPAHLPAPAVVLSSAQPESVRAAGGVAFALDVPAPVPASGQVFPPGPPSAAASSGSVPTSGGRVATDQRMSGVMFAPGAAAASHRRPTPPPYLDMRSPQPTQDLSLLVGLAVIGLTSIGATAVLMTFAHQPGGFGLVAMVTKPTPTLSLVVQGGLALVGLALAAKYAVGGVKKWRGDLEGGRSGAVVFALIAGALFFAAIELARAAW